MNSGNVNNPMPNRDGSGIPVIQEPQGGIPQFFKIIMRWKWLPIMGTLIGVTIGYLIFSQQPPQYKATAQVLVVSPVNEIPVSALDLRTDTQPRADELVIVQSYVVLRNAIDIGQLTKQPKFMNMTEDAIVNFLKRPSVLDLKLGSKDQLSNIITISVTTDDPQLSVHIVDAIVSGYEDFVTSKFKTHTQEAISALTKFNMEYGRKREAAKKELNDLRANLALDWSQGVPHDPLGDRILRIADIVSGLDTKSKNLEAILQQVRTAQEANRPIEDVLKMISAATNDSTLSQANLSSEATIRMDRVRQIRSKVESFEELFVDPVRTQLAIEEENYGQSFPLVLALKNKLSKLERDLETKRANADIEVEKFEKEYGELRGEPVTPESRLQLAVGAIKEELQKINIERLSYKAEADSLRSKSQENQTAISNYQFALKELEALGQDSDQISEALRKLTLGAEYGQKTVKSIEIPRNGVHVGPSWLKYLGLGAFAGCALCCGLAYLLEMADRSYRNPEEISSDLGMPIVGHLPLATISRSERIDEKVDSSIVTLHKPRSPLSEAVRGVRTALFFSCHGANKIIQITSPIPGDGKSTMAANLAASVAQSGRSVCIVDCDFRRPRLGKIFGLKEDVGFVQAIAGKISLQDALQPTSIQNLTALTCGRRPANPAELLSSEVFGELLEQLRKQFDYVFLDTPPMLVVSDPAIVCSHCDGVILAIRLRRNLRPIATRAAQMLHALNANMIGVVVNGIGMGGHGYGYGGYRYDNYSGGKPSSGYGASGYGGYGYGATFQYGGVYGTAGVDYYDDEVPKLAPKPPKEEKSPA